MLLRQRIEVKTFTTKISVIGKKIYQYLLIITVEVGGFHIRSFHGSTEGNLYILHPQEVVDLKPPVIDEAIAGQHDTNIMSHRFHSFRYAACNVPDTPALNEGVRLRCYKKYTY